MGYYDNKFSKKTYTTADRMARLKAEGMTEAFNEPAVILEGPNEFVVLRGITWDARKTWGKSDLPLWAKKKPESFLVETILPKDHLAGNYAKVRKQVNKMRETAGDLAFKNCFEIDDMCREYSDVRLMLQLVRSAAEHLSSVLIHLDFAVEDAIKQHEAKQEKTDDSEV